MVYIKKSKVRNLSTNLLIQVKKSKKKKLCPKRFEKESVTFSVDSGKSVTLESQNGNIP